MPSALADQLTTARRRAFVGRRAELAFLDPLLTAVETGGIGYVHGPGGVGKSTFLRQLAWLGGQAGRRVVWFDAHDAVDAGLPECLAPALGVPPGEVRESLAKTPRLLILVDAAELLGPPDRWLREELLTVLPGDAVAVVAGRDAPPLAWRVDPGWRGLLRTVALSNLSAAEGAEMLSALGVAESAHPSALAFTRGHPLALALVADVCAQPGGAVALDANPQVVTALLAGLLDAVPTPRHRAALEACAQVRVTTEPLLATLLDLPDARELFDWLRGLSVMEYGPRGIHPHDLARDALGAELRWRHPERYAELHRRAGTYYQQQLRGADPAAQQMVLADFTYLHRDSPVFGPYLTSLSPSSGAGDLAVAAPRPGDWPAVLSLVERHEGTAAARAAEHWFARQPESFVVVRDAAGAVGGVCAVLALHAVDDADRRADPAVDAARRYLDRHAPLRAEERASLVRFWFAAEEYQAVSPAATTAITMHLARLYLTTPDLAVSLQSYADPDAWAPVCGYADFARVPEADYAVGGRAYGVYAHDWRVVPTLAWLTLLAARETADEPLAIPSAGAAAPVRVLDAEEFARALRAALGELSRPDRLRTSPLVRSRLVSALAGADTAPAARVRVIQEVVREAAVALEASPRDRRAYRALHHTYLQPAGSQQRAADLLNLPMSTFRRHLAAGIDRLTEILWERELGGG